VLPIGGTAFAGGIGDKRPEVIAALAAAEILVQIGREKGAERRRTQGRAMTSETVHGG
jgi:xanthine/CO dehydrogenase XdhC/CoxF family maturation factor